MESPSSRTTKTGISRILSSSLILGFVVLGLVYFQSVVFRKEFAHASTYQYEYNSKSNFTSNRTRANDAAAVAAGVAAAEKRLAEMGKEVHQAKATLLETTARLETSEGKFHELNRLYNSTLAEYKTLEKSSNRIPDQTSQQGSEQEHPEAAPEEVNSATGSLFSGDIIREFSPTKRLFLEDVSFDETVKDIQKNNNREGVVFIKPEFASSCSKWGVVTTIFDPTDAIVRVANMPGWCLVIAADTKTPSDYMELANLTGPEYSNRVFFFSVEEQKRWTDIAANNNKEGGENSTNPQAARHAIADFVKAIPFRHFARKNLGYFFAILHGAKFIFDFDDDNFVKMDPLTGATMDILPNEDQEENVGFVLQGGKNHFNPYPLMGASANMSWPRGFPLESIQDIYTQGKLVFSKNVSMQKVGVIQFCADGDPDIDAIHRLAKPLPMTFSPPTSQQSILVPEHTFVPYNAQATIHTAPAFWATLLPSTVPGRVSDIWRSYFAECLFRDLDLGIIFAPPKIEQVRNAHNYLGDLKAELDLYFKSGALIDFLDNWVNVKETIPERMEDLWIDLYERGYIEYDDVIAVQKWLAALIHIDYSFPKLVRRRHHNVVLMGHFNHAPSTTDFILLWIQKYRRDFQKVQVRGPFNETALHEFGLHGVEVYRGENIGSGQPGFFEPMTNLGKALLQHKNSSAVDGVIFIHDDGVVDMIKLSGGRFPFPSNSIIGTMMNRGGPEEFSYVNPRTTDDLALAAKKTFRVFPNGTSANFAGNVTYSTLKELNDAVGGGMRPKCLPGQAAFAQNPLSVKYREKDGTVVFPAMTQSDLLYVPTKFADTFIELDELLVKHKVYLECSAGTIVDKLQHFYNATVRTFPLCTIWGGRRGKTSMVDLCLQKTHGGENPFGFYHPLKSNFFNLSKWDAVFDYTSSAIQDYSKAS